MKRPLVFKALRWIFFPLVCLATLAGLIVAEENLRGKLAWERCRRELEAQGEHLDLAWFTPPPVPDAQNFAMIPLLKALFPDPVTGKIDPHAPVYNIRVYGGYSTKLPFPKQKVGSWQTGTPRDLEPWQAYYWAAFPEMAHSPSPAEDVITATNSLNGIFVELREAAKARPLSRFNIQYEKGPGATVPHYAILQALVNVLGLRATAELRLNRPTDAFEDVRLAFLTVDSIRGEPLLISGLVRISFISILNGPIWEGIVLHRWTDDQLLTLETQLRRIDCLSDYSRGIRAERAESSELLKMISADPRIAGLFDPPLSKPAGAILPWMKLLPGWADQNLVRENQWIQEILSCVDGEAQRVDVARASREKEELEERGHPTPYTFLARGIARNCNATLPKFTVAQAWVNEAIIACAIERYRLAHGALPATLDELHMAALPHDVVNGEPLRYRVAGDDNYVLYSVGWNGVDDGGKAVKKSNGAIDLTRGDWVWSLRPF